MDIIVQTTRTRGYANVRKQVIRNIATLSFNFQFQCINCSWFGAIKFVFELSPQKEVHGREVWRTRRVFKWHPFVQSLRLEKLHRGELVHHDGSAEVLHLAEGNSRHHQTSLKFVHRQTPEAVHFLRHHVYRQWNCLSDI